MTSPSAFYRKELGAPALQKPPEKVLDPTANWRQGSRSHECSDDGLTQEFVRRHSGELRYVPDLGQWRQYQHGVWREEKTTLAFDLARDIAREAALAAESTSVRKQLRSAATMAAIERMARCDRGIVVLSKEFDADPFIVNCPDGEIDLKTGQVHPHRAEHFLSMSTAVAPSNQTPKLWLEFLNTVCNGDEAQVRYLQKLCGYCLSGDTREETFHFFFGNGANGKSVFLNTLLDLMGSYSRKAGINTFLLEKYGTSHPEGLARLAGSRLVVISEPSEGQFWNETLLRDCTGGGNITARFMRCNTFEFRPAFKLIAEGNNRPHLSGVDESIRRRFRVLHFPVTIPAERRDLELPAKLKREWGGILAWAIEGFALWQAQGLQPTEAIKTATAAYLSSQDIVGQWASECCEFAKHLTETSAELYKSFSLWLRANGEPGQTHKALSSHLSKLPGVRVSPNTTRRGFIGIAVKRYGN